MTRSVRFAACLAGAWIACLPAHSPPLPQDAPGATVSERIGSRVLIASNLMAPYQVALDCGKVEWKTADEATFDEQTLGKRFRLGSDFWASLDAFATVTIGGKEVKPGYWYLALERSKKGDWFLVVLDSEPLRKKRIDASKSNETSGGTLAPLKHEKLEPTARQLAIGFQAVPPKPTDYVLEIRIGPHKLTADVTVRI